MNKIISYVFPFLLTQKSLEPLSLVDFHEVKFVNDDTWNCYSNADIHLEYFKELPDIPKKYEGIGYISYRPMVGQIGLIRLNHKYRERGLGKQMVQKAIKDIKERGNSNEVWAVTSKDHPFWSNVWGGSFVWRDPAHSSVTGNGYVLDITKWCGADVLSPKLSKKEYS